MKLFYVVIIFVDCDDLDDLGVVYWVKMILEIKCLNLEIIIEVLIFDF